jgi:small conductance mechanosensitive channel
MRFFALTTATADLPEVPDIQESLTAIQKFIKTASPVVLNALWHIALALVIFFVGRWLIEKFLSRVALLDNKTKIDPGVAKFVRSLVRVALWALLIYFIADFLGVPTASFVALLGSIGVTVGLALQGSLSNFAGGLILMFLHPFKTGDYIKTASDIEGTVVEIGLFFTTLRMADNKIITIPNGSLSAGNIINYNVLPVRRLSTTVGIAYEADTARAIELLTALIKSRKPLVNPEKALVYVKELGDSSVVLGLHYWVKTDDYWDEAWSINQAIKDVLDQNGIAIPFNQLDVHVIQ